MSSLGSHTVIVLACSLLLGYEYVAKATHKPTVTDLSHTWPYALVVWTWLVWLMGHFIYEGARSRDGVVGRGIPSARTPVVVGTW